jgi:hypothetical protein
MALKSTQTLTEMSTRNISRGLRRPVRGTDVTTSSCLEIREPQPPGNLRACPGLYRDSFICDLTKKNYKSREIYTHLEKSRQV